MDDMKRAIYLDVLSTLEEEDCNTYICNQLLYRLKDTLGIRYGDKSQEVLREFFPELFALFDGYRYYSDRRRMIQAHQAWFSSFNRHARLSLINFLLTCR